MMQRDRRQQTPEQGGNLARPEAITRQPAPSPIREAPLQDLSTLCLPRGEFGRTGGIDPVMTKTFKLVSAGQWLARAVLGGTGTFGAGLGAYRMFMNGNFGYAFGSAACAVGAGLLTALFAAAAWQSACGERVGMG
jgi:hypothetical protein